jgi:hypothetical protein
MTDDFDLIPLEYRMMLAKAYDERKLGITIVLSHKSMKDLKENRTTALALDDGGVVVIIPQKLVEEYYAEEDQNKS